MKRPRGSLIGASLLCALLAAVTGCQDQEAKAELEKFRAAAAVQEQNKEIVKQLMAGLNNRDVNYKDLYAPNAALYFPSAASKPITPDEDLESSKNNWRAFPDIHWTIEGIAAEGDMVWVRFIAKGTQKEAWRGIPSRGRAVESSGLFMVRIENGKVIEQREDFDLLGWMTQMGMELKLAKANK